MTNYLANIENAFLVIHSTKISCLNNVIPLVAVVALASVYQSHVHILVKTTSFERYFSKRGASFFRGGAQNFKLAGPKSRQGGSRFRGAPPLWKKASVRPIYTSDLVTVKNRKSREFSADFSQAINSLISGLAVYMKNINPLFLRRDIPRVDLYV